MTRALTCSVLFLVAASASAQEHPALRWGMPDTGHILVQDTFVMSYDGRLRSARWTAERLTAASLVVGTDVVRQNRFRRSEDQATAPRPLRRPAVPHRGRLERNVDLNQVGFEIGIVHQTREAQALSSLSTNDERHGKPRGPFRVQRPKHRVMIAIKAAPDLSGRHALHVELPDRDLFVRVGSRVRRRALPTPRAWTGSFPAHRRRDQRFGVLCR